MNPDRWLARQVTGLVQQQGSMLRVRAAFPSQYRVTVSSLARSQRYASVPERRCVFLLYEATPYLVVGG